MEKREHTPIWKHSSIREILIKFELGDRRPVPPSLVWMDDVKYTTWKTQCYKIDIDYIYSLVDCIKESIGLQTYDKKFFYDILENLRIDIEKKIDLVLRKELDEKQPMEM